MESRPTFPCGSNSMPKASSWCAMSEPWAWPMDWKPCWTRQTSYAMKTRMSSSSSSEKGRSKAIAQSRGLSNVRFLDQQPREKIPAIISASDACVVLLKKTEVFKTVIPTKMLEFMSCARPVILGVGGQVQKIVEEAEAGIVIEPENSRALAHAIGRLAGDPSLGDTLGTNGRKYIARRFSRRQTAENYLHVLEELCGIFPARKAPVAA